MRCADPASVTTELGAALRSWPVVDQACGIVMHVLGCDADAAFGVLRRISRGTSRRLSDVAAVVVRRRGRGLEREPVSLSGGAAGERVFTSPAWGRR
ncbi:ANTAR domain-containing protein [Streptomyces caeni]|uniref:ANTAR domain-containing protein n=1 Tax=Streptomyces caeni TaxID=2307231 RepID=A0ABW4IVT6_9ACTN